MNCALVMRNQFRIHTTPRGSRKWRLHSENVSNVLRPHHAREIGKRSNHRSFCKNSSGRGTLSGVTLSFSKTAFKVFSVRTKPQIRCFHIHKKLRFRNGLVLTEDQTGRKAPFSNSSGLVWTRPIRSFMKSAAFKPGAILALLLACCFGAFLS